MKVKTMTRQVIRTGLLIMLLLLAALMLTVNPLFAQDEPGPEPEEEQEPVHYNVQVVQTDTSNFPNIDVWVSVTDEAGNPVGTLPEEAFTLIENGQSVDVQQVYQAGDQGPVSTVLAIDRSGSMLDYGKLDAAKAAATAFVDRMRPQDATGLVVFNTQVETLQPLTTDKGALRDAINRLQAFNDTAMYDALAESVSMLSGVSGRRAIIVLSDGLDNMSQRTADDIIGSIAGAEVSVYAIGLGDPTAAPGSTSGIDEAALRAIAQQSRGEYMYQPEPEGLAALYEQLSYQLQNEYRLSYVSPNSLYDGVERGVEVRVAETGGAQTGYNPGGVIPETSQALGWPIFGGLLAGLVVLLIVPGLIRRARGGGGGGGSRPRRRGRSRVKLSTPGGSTPREKSVSPDSGRVRLRGKGG
jgi:Ca-activated chloride channel family protein